MEVNPSEMTLKTQPAGGFLFLVDLLGFNMSDTHRLFDFTLRQESFTTGYVLQNSTEIPMVACTEEHFGFNDEIKSLFWKMNAGGALCPPLGQELTLKGKASSDLYSHFRVVATRCNTSDPNCANDTYFTAVEASIG